MTTVPLIDATAIFGSRSAARAAADAAILAAAVDSGFLVLAGLPASVPVDAVRRRELLRLFELPDAAKRRLWRKAAARENPNVYRGYFPLSTGVIKEGMDIGPADPMRGARGDALTEPTPMPAEDALPGWQEQVHDAYAGLEAVGATLMRSLARGLGLRETTFDEAFRGGISTLRLIRYPAWPPLAEKYGLTPRPAGPGQYDIGGEHVDSGFVTLLQQDGVEGLQAHAPDGAWIDVPHVEHTLVVNFGKLLERWTGGRIRATEHRVLGNDTPRCSIPFFYEPRVDARIAPLEIAGAEPFETFSYGDHVWEAMSDFPEFQNAERFADSREGAANERAAEAGSRSGA